MATRETHERVGAQRLATTPHLCRRRLVRAVHQELELLQRGDAQVTYNNNIIQAEELIAYYRQKPDGNSDIFRLDATGNVHKSALGPAS